MAGTALLLLAHGPRAPEARGADTSAPTPPEVAAVAGPTMLVLEEAWRATGTPASGTPLLTADAVIANDPAGGLQAFDLDTGAPTWSLPTDSGPSLPFRAALVAGVALRLVHEDGSPTATLVAVEPGAEALRRWTVTFDMAAAQPYGVPVATEDGGIVVRLYRPEDASRPEEDRGQAHGYVVLDATDGRERFRLLFTDCQATGGGLVVSPMDTFLGGDDVPRGITARDTRTGEERWFLAEQVNGCPIATEDTVYLDPFDAEGLVAIEAATGDLRWAVAAPQSDEPLIADASTLYVERVVDRPDGQPDEARVVAFDAASGQPRWESAPVPGEIESASLAGGRVLLATSDSPGDQLQGGLVILDNDTGREIGFVDRALLGAAGSDGRVASITWDAEADDQGTLRLHVPREVRAVVDVAAMTPTVSDLEAVGLAGFVVGSGSTTPADAVVRDTSESRGLPESEVRAALEGAGLVRRYDLLLSLPGDPTDPTSAAVVVVNAYVTEFADADGAAAAFDFLEDESWNQAARDLEAYRDLGDGSEMTVEDGVDPASGSGYALADLTIRHGNVHVGVAAIDWKGDPAPVDALGELGVRLLERAALVAARPTSTLGDRVLRLMDAETSVLMDRYTVRDARPQPPEGQLVVPYEEPSRARLARLPVDAYQRQVHRARPDGDSWITSDAQRYRTREAALRALEDVRDDLASNDDLRELDIQDAPDLGEGAFRYTATATSSGLRYVGARFAVDVRVGSLEWIGAMDDPDAVGTIGDLAARARTCLEEGCREPQPIPAALTS